MIDIHSHFISYIDDGAKDIKETIHMIKEAEKAGFTNIIATPHYIQNYYEKEGMEISSYIEKLQELANQEEVKVNLHSGMEIYISEQIQELLLENKILKLANSKYILIELPMILNVKYFDDEIFTLKSMGLIPIIAHPERYEYVQKNPKIIEDYIEMGCLIQCNYGSIINIYGKKAKETIKYLLKRNLVNFLGSDCHRKNDIYLLIPKAMKKMEKILGQDMLYKLTTENPNKIINNEEV